MLILMCLIIQELKVLAYLNSDRNPPYYRVEVTDTDNSDKNFISFQSIQSSTDEYTVDMLKCGINFHKDQVYQYYGDADSLDEDSVYRFSNFQTTDSIIYKEIVDGITNKTYENMIYSECLLPDYIIDQLLEEQLL